MRRTAHTGEKCTRELFSMKNKFTVHVKKKAAGKLQTEKGLTPFFEKNLLEFPPIVQRFIIYIIYIYNLQLFPAH